MFKATKLSKSQIKKLMTKFHELASLILEEINSEHFWWYSSTGDTNDRCINLINIPLNTTKDLINSYSIEEAIACIKEQLNFFLNNPPYVHDIVISAFIANLNEFSKKVTELLIINNTFKEAELKAKNLMNHLVDAKSREEQTRLREGYITIYKEILTWAQEFWYSRAIKSENFVKLYNKIKHSMTPKNEYENI